MSRIFSNIIRHTKRVAIFGSLFLAVFFGTFYIINMDFSSKNGEKAAPESQSQLSQDEELKKRLGTTSVELNGYAGWEQGYGVPASDKGMDGDADKDGLANYLEYAHGTNPMKADTDGDGFSDTKEIQNGYDPDAAGDIKPLVFVKIAKLGVDVPMVWSQKDDEKSMLKDLESGISHYPKTIAPGQNGNSVLSGHSSNYLWAKGDYNYVFRTLNDLEKGDVVAIKLIQQNGRIFNYKFAVSEKFVTTANDPRIFEQTLDPEITLSTCWPIGTNFKRIIVRADMVK